MKIDTEKLRQLIVSQGFSNKRLAEEAGLTRQALQAILRKDQAEVRGRTLQGLLRALRLPDENSLREDPLTGYKELVAEEHARLDFRGLGLPTTEPRLLDALFVPIRVRQ